MPNILHIFIYNHGYYSIKDVKKKIFTSENQKILEKICENP